MGAQETADPSNVAVVSRCETACLWSFFFHVYIRVVISYEYMIVVNEWNDYAWTLDWKTFSPNSFLFWGVIP